MGEKPFGQDNLLLVAPRKIHHLLEHAGRTDVQRLAVVLGDAGLFCLVQDRIA